MLSEKDLAFQDEFVRFILLVAISIEWMFSGISPEKSKREFAWPLSLGKLIVLS